MGVAVTESTYAATQLLRWRETQPSSTRPLRIWPLDALVASDLTDRQRSAQTKFQLGRSLEKTVFSSELWLEHKRPAAWVSDRHICSLSAF